MTKFVRGGLLMDPLVASIVGNVASGVVARITEQLGADKTPPEKPTVENLIKRLIDAGIFGRITPETAKEELGIDAAQYWIRRLMRTAVGKNLPLDEASLDRLVGTCLGTVSGGTDSLPISSNRPPMPVLAAGGPALTHLFVIEDDSIPSGLGLSVEEVKGVVGQAWDLWMGATPRLRVRMAETKADRKKANLTIRFATLDGSGGELGVTKTVWNSGGGGQFTITIDTSEHWTPSKLLATVTHEIGHALGLEHSSDEHAIMAAYLDPALTAKAWDKIALAQADRDAIQVNWG